MALETGTFISDLVVANPLDSDPKAQGAGHLRLIKAALKTTLPNIMGAVTPTHTELNYMAGVTSGVQVQLAAEITNRTAADALKADKAGSTFTGPVLLPTQGVNVAEAVRKDYADALAFASSLPAQAGNAGKVVTTNGSLASWASPYMANPWAAVTATTQAAVAGGRYSLQNVAATTVTLPASPSANDYVAVKVSNGLKTNVIARNGQTIEGIADDLTIDSNFTPIALQFINSSWRFV